MDECEQFVLHKDYPNGGKIWLMLGLDTSGLDYNDLICIFVEYESYTTAQPKNAFRNMLNDGLAQSDRIIIRECNLTDNYMKQRIQGKIQNGFPIITLWTFNGEEIRLLYNTEG